MAGHREEAYSDWLQWIVAESEPTEVLRVFGINNQEMHSACAGCAVTVVRKRSVPRGHDGHSGRLDLEIQLGDTALLVVEIKLGEAGNADTEKGTGYRQSLEAIHQHRQFKRFIILVSSAADEDYFGFKPRLWADACIELRLIVTRLCARCKHLRAAMILAFVGAVEQNLLGLRCFAGGANPIAAALALPPATEHITQCLDAFENDQNEQIRSAT